MSIKSITSYFFLISSIAIIIFTSVSIVFPALIVRLTSGSQFSDIDPLEFGTFAIPLFLTNSIFFGTYFALKRKLLPNSIHNFFNFLLKIDISKKVGFIILLMIISIYVSLTFEEIFQEEEIADNRNVLRQLEEWQIYENILDTINQFHTKLFFLVLSDILFNNMRIIPFFASISMLFVVYFLSVQITSKRISGLIPVVILIQSHIFREYDTIMTYTNFWVVFYLLSLYLINKPWPLSSVSYILSFFAKPMTLGFFPQSLFYILNADLKRRKKLLTLIPYLIAPIMIGILVFVITSPNPSFVQQNFIFHPPRFFSGFSILSYQLRYDLFIMLSLIPLSFLLYKKFRLGQNYALSMLVLISGSLVTGALMVGLFNYQINPYRLQPFIAFVAMGVGLLFSKERFRKN